MIKKFLIILLFSTLLLPSFCQTGGDNVYEFLNLTYSGLVAALGGSNVSLEADDINMSYHNPSLLTDEMNGSLALSYVNYFAGINYGQVIYGRTLKGAGNIAGGLTYLNYGKFTEADETGLITGTFSASEYAFPVIWSHEIDSLFSVGVDLKPVLSHLEKYTSFGFALDIGASWHSRNNLVSAGIALKNIGMQITSYAGESREKLPFEIQAGVSGKLAYAPFRFSITLRHMEKWDLTHQYLTSDEVWNTDTGSSEFIENLFRHVITGVEIIPHKNFYICGGYNYQRRKELQVDSKVSTVGFSWGFGVKTSLLDVEFGRATYHLAGSSTHISVILKTNSIYHSFRK